MRGFLYLYIPIYSFLLFIQNHCKLNIIIGMLSMRYTVFYRIKGGIS
jgi:hypothetical protein